MNVLHVIPSVSSVHGGPSRAIAMIEQILVAAGVSVTTATTDDDGPHRRLEAGKRPAMVNGAIRIYRRKWIDFYKVAPGLVLWLWRNVRSFDVVHIHALFSFTSGCAGIIARLRGVPYVVRPLGTLSVYGVTRRRPFFKEWSLRLIEGPILRGAAAVHFTSEAERQEAVALGIRFAAVVIPLAVETMAPAGAAPAISAPRRVQGALEILFLSRLDPKKNLEVVLRAFAGLVRTHPDCRLVIAGDGPQAYVESLRRLARSLAVEQSLRWCGHVEGAEKRALLASADVFVLPSVSENFGIAAAEALAAGLPCVLGGGVAIANDAAATGVALVVDPEPEELLAALVRLADDPALRAEMGARARRHAEEFYSTGAMAQRLIALYGTIENGQSKSDA